MFRLGWQIPHGQVSQAWQPRFGAASFWTGARLGASTPYLAEVNTVHPFRFGGVDRHPHLIN